jgi:integrase
VGNEKKAAQEAKKASQVKTFGQLIPVYLKDREFGTEFWSRLRPKSLIEVTRYLEKTWKPLHANLVDQITRETVEDRRDEIVSESGAATANQALAAAATFFAWAINRRHVKGDWPNPTRDIKALKQAKRERVLSEAELVGIWQACSDDDFGRIVRLLMLTGQRRQEIGGLEWEEISLERRQISLPAARCKNGRPHIVPLSEPALALLQGIPSDGKYVFGPFANWCRCKRDLDRRTAARARWTLHDIRRSVVTHIAELGIAQPHVIEAIVNHVSGSKAGVAGVYNRASYLKEKREALEKWGLYLMDEVSVHLTSGKNSNPEKSEAIDGPLSSGTRLP